MADSNITKRALALALKELIKTHPIEKISVGNICDVCGMNRKSFYYHFQDKYELINWIYYTEFLKTALENPINDSRELLDAICCYFYENREFYAKTFRIEGQNSFSDTSALLSTGYLQSSCRIFFLPKIPLIPMRNSTRTPLCAPSKSGFLKKTVYRPWNFPSLFRKPF